MRHLEQQDRRTGSRSSSQERADRKSKDRTSGSIVVHGEWQHGPRTVAWDDLCRRILLEILSDDDTPERETVGLKRDARGHQ